MLACRNGERDSLTIRAHLLDPGRGLDGPGVLTIEDGVVTAVAVAAGVQVAEGATILSIESGEAGE